MVSPPNLVAKYPTKPHGTQSEHQLSGDVDVRQQAFPIVPEVNCLVAEAREGCKPTDNADDYERANLGRKGPATLRQLRQQADDEAPNDIDGERADREIVALGPSLHEPTQHIAKNRPNEPTDADEENLAHAESPTTRILQESSAPGVQGGLHRRTEC